MSRVTNEVASIVEQIQPLLAGRGSAIQGAVLADLLAMLLAGHFPATIREPLLQSHIETVRRLIPINEAILLKRYEHLKSLIGQPDDGPAD